MYSLSLIGNRVFELLAVWNMGSCMTRPTFSWNESNVKAELSRFLESCFHQVVICEDSCSTSRFVGVCLQIDLDLVGEFTAPSEQEALRNVSQSSHGHKQIEGSRIRRVWRWSAIRASCCPGCWTVCTCVKWHIGKCRIAQKEIHETNQCIVYFHNHNMSSCRCC